MKLINTLTDTRWRVIRIMNLNELEDFVSIGELSRVTGITTHTLRMWEKRYGTPKAKRLPSGHRRYPKKDIPRLRAIAKALDSGYRASKVVTGTLEQLHSLMGLQPLVESTSSFDYTAESRSILKESVVERLGTITQQSEESTTQSTTQQTTTQQAPPTGPPPGVTSGGAGGAGGY